MLKFRMRNTAPPADETPRAPWIVAVDINRALGRVVVFLVVVVVGQSIWHQLRPVIKEVPVYVEFQTGANNFVVLQRAGGNVTADEGLISREARRYVAMREPIDKTTEEKRYPEVRELSCPKVWDTFKSKYGSPDGPYKREGYKREIRIMRDSRLADGVHQVEFDTRSWVDGSGVTQEEAKWESWVATMAYRFDEKKKRMDDIVVNPMGWQTCEYSVSKRSKE